MHARTGAHWKEVDAGVSTLVPSFLLSKRGRLRLETISL